MNGSISLFELSPEQSTSIRRTGFIKLQVFNPETIEYFNKAISDRVAKMNTVKQKWMNAILTEKRFFSCSTCGAKMKRSNNLCSKTAGKIAAGLMQVDGVRLYHDQALFKKVVAELLRGIADQYYWPLDRQNCYRVDSAARLLRLRWSARIQCRQSPDCWRPRTWNWRRKRDTDPAAVCG